MFRLEDEIRAWAESIRSRAGMKTDSLDELLDHLYSSVQAFTAAGLSEEEAFEATLRQLGEEEDLAKEYAKNRSFFDELRADPDDASPPESRQRSVRSMKRLTAGMVAYLILFAIVIFTATYLLRGTEHFEGIAVLLFFLWMAPLTIFGLDQGSAKEEWACLRRAISRRIRGEDGAE